MSREQVETFRRIRDANDDAANLAWANGVKGKAVRPAPERGVRLDVEVGFKFTDDEKVVWRLIKIVPRKYTDVENCGAMPADKLRGVLRGLVEAKVLEVVDGSDGKGLLPSEVRRLKAELANKDKDPPPGKEQPKAAFRPHVIEPPAPEAAKPKPSGPRLGDEDRTYKDEIERAFAAMNKQTHFEFLAVTRPGDDVAIRQAYVRLARLYHPDRVAGGAFATDESIRSKVDALFRKLGDANEVLATSDSRMAYAKTLDAGASSHDAEGKQRRPAEANHALRMAETFFKKRDFKAAELHFKQAIKFDGEEPKILTAFAWFLSQNPDLPEKARTADAIKRLNDVVLQHRYADAAYKAGVLTRKIGDEAGAQEYFAKCHHLDADHVDAQREVRLTGRRQEKKDEKAGGLFGGIFKK